MLSRARSSASRQLVLVVLPPNVRPVSLDAWASDQARRGGLSVPSVTAADPADRLRSRLGTELADVYARLPVNVRPSDIAALLGAVRAGHSAILVLPGEALRRSALLRRWLERCLLATRGAPSIQVRYPARGCLTRRRPSATGRRPAAMTGPPPGPGPRGASPTDLARQDERHRDAVERLGTDPQACIVFVGPRGSGKSTQLARLVPRLQALDEHGRAPLVITAGARRCSTLNAWLPGMRIHDAQALASHDTRALVIDEAASLPLAVLQSALDRPVRVVMASTVDGYEASGRAFAGRLLDRLAARRPRGTMSRTSGRFRFLPDAVQATLHDAFLLDALGTPPEGSPPGRAAIGSLHLERIAPPLIHRQALAARLVALLGATHYRASLDELDPLLDGRLAIWIARDANDTLVAAATLAAEGDLPAVLHADILAGRRRLPDQLLPQLLARSAADDSALGERYARITRIAVLPGWRRHGIATRLLERVRRDLSPSIALGASFAEGAGVERFWRQAGFETFHRGLRVNPRSGHRSVAVLSNGTPRTGSVLSRARAVLADNQGVRQDTSRDAELLARFARAERGLAETLGPLQRAWHAWRGDARESVLDAAIPLGLPATASGRRLERALVRWAARHLHALHEHAPDNTGQPDRCPPDE